MDEHDGKSGFYVSRLDFLRYSLATNLAVWAGAGVPAGLGIDEAEAQELFGAAGVPVPLPCEISISPGPGI